MMRAALANLHGQVACAGQFMSRRDLPIHLTGSAMRRLEVSVRCFLCTFFLCCSLAALGQSSIPQTSNAVSGSFYVNGIVYHYIAGTDYAVVAAAHSGLNHKFVAVKMRVYNVGKQSVRVKPEDVRVEDALAGQAPHYGLGHGTGQENESSLNLARLAVNPVAGEPTDTPPANDTVNPQLLEMMRAMAAHVNGAGTPMLPGSRGALYTDTPGALQSQGPVQTIECDTVCRLCNRETANPDVLTQLQRQNSPEYVEQSVFLANTITPPGPTWTASSTSP